MDAVIVAGAVPIGNAVEDTAGVILPFEAGTA